MAAMGTSSAAKSHNTSRGWFASLVSALLEWLLIFFLFFDAVFSYVITRFARGCKLQTPCLLCSRLDHVLGKEKVGYYWDLMCKNHKSEISSLVLCHAHNKLVDVHKMCESCLFSFATINKSNAETYRLLVGKLGEEVNSDFDEDALLGDSKISSLSKRYCACCNQPWVPRAHAQKLIQTRLVGSDAAELETPLSGAIEHNQEEVMKKGRERSFVSAAATHSKTRGLDPLSHIGYTELKISSDTESEAPLSDDDGGGVSALVRERNDYEEEYSVQYVEPRIVTLDDALASEKLLDPASGPKPSFLEPHVQVDALEHLDHKPEESTVASGKSEEEFSVEQVHLRTVTLDDVSASEKRLDPASGLKPSLLESHVQVDDIEPLDCKPQESTVGVGHGLEELNWQGVEKKADIPRQEVGDKADIAELTETTLRDTPSSDATETPLEVSKNCLDVRTVEVTQTSSAECGEVSKGESLPRTTTETGLETNTIASDSGQQVINLLDLGDAYKLAVDNKGRQLSGVLAEQWLGKDSSRVSEDLRILLTQLSANRGFDQSINDISPKLSVNSDDSKTLDCSSSIGRQILHKRISLERNESGLSMDGSIVSEIEGESMVDRLKRQVEHDKKLMNALYRELEEERNASAVATNQAMAMITRLQEEKAALQMEALQYLRMMEEQAEYDDDELQKSNDLLSEKEKEIQDLEAELEYYRKKFPNERVLENPSETSCDVKITDIGVDNSEYSCIRDNASVSTHPISGKPHDNDKVESAGLSFENVDRGNVNSSVLEFEDEKTYILQCLKKLEKTLYLLSDDEKNTYLSKNDYSENRTDEFSELEELTKHDESVSGQDLYNSSLENPELNGRETDEFHCRKQSSAELSQVTDMASLRVVVSDLNKRLEALEADRKFLEHAVNSLRNGDEGLHFIQEITSHLQELRKIVLRKDQSVA
ncbi:myosin-binding protein 1 isoform X1 [Morus notabilis]|uniref:myosin-binding protein 1 isoform X1 n=1 Tax=Morus notabilis TaxID=981085 RepID=UPI000CECE4CC|nr:myosin-binding protein 1 isoform X1 [Morus notabilis]